MTGHGWQQPLGWWTAHWTWLFWGLVLLVMVKLGIRWSRISAASSRTARGSPEEILRLRYASGEIDRSEYARRRAHLHRLRKSA